MRRCLLILVWTVGIDVQFFSQNEPSSKVISNHSYGNTLVGKTVIQDVIKENGAGFHLDSVKYIKMFADMGGYCMHIMGTHKLYRYKYLGITYIVTNGDTISGIVFYPPFAGHTDKGEAIGITKLSSLNVPTTEGKIHYSNPSGNFDDGGRENYMENAKHYIKIDHIFYGFKRRSGNVTEIRIGR